MLLYDDTAAEALHAATDEAGRLGAAKYQTAHVLLGLLRTADPVTETVTADEPRLTVDAVCTALGASPMQATDANAEVAHGRRSTPEPAADVRHAARRFTAKWRPLVRGRQLRPGPKLGTGELWLTVLEPGTTAAHVLQSLGIEPDDVRPLVLARWCRTAPACRTGRPRFPPGHSGGCSSGSWDREGGRDRHHRCCRPPGRPLQ